MQQGPSPGGPVVEIQLTLTIRPEHLDQLSRKVLQIKAISAELTDRYLGSLVERLLQDIAVASRTVERGTDGLWYAPAAELGTLQGAGHTLDRIGSALYLNLPIYLPELRTSRRISGQQHLASHLREAAALCTFIAYHLGSSSR